MKSYLRDRWRLLLLLLSLVGIFALVLYLSDLPLSAVGYGALLCGATGLVAFFVDFSLLHARRQTLDQVQAEMITTLEHLPAPCTQMEAQYQAMLRGLKAQKDAVQTDAVRQAQETLDYYTLWAHQIKTPISAMHLLLSAGTGTPQELEAELFRIEEYVEMVLNFQRLSGQGNDLMLRRQKLDPLVRRCIRKYARQFIRKKLALDYGGTDLEVLTDEKWLCFVIEQLLSNALKYTKQGKISLRTEGQALVIADTGIGIAAEDLPRVFERGYTGYNGRSQQKSTGIGLYLCKRITSLLGHTIHVDSVQGQGTQVRLGLEITELENE